MKDESDFLAGLTQKQQRFVTLILQGSTDGEAYRTAYAAEKMKSTTVATAAQRLKASSKVAAALKAARTHAANTVNMTMHDVLRDWVDIHTADPNELTSYQRRCCRHCWGINNAYQWRNPAEWSAATAKAMDEQRGKRDKPTELPSMEGGFDYDFTKRPAQDCPQCRGEGIGDVYIHDTTQLSPKARKLYAGVKRTATGGIEVLMRSQDGALTNIAKVLGMFTDKIQLTGAGGGPVVTAQVALPADAQEAAKIYQQLMKGTQ